MSTNLNKETVVYPIVEAINALQEQRSREYEQNLQVLTRVMEEIRGIRQELESIRKAVRDMPR